MLPLLLLFVPVLVFLLIVPPLRGKSIGGAGGGGGGFGGSGPDCTVMVAFNGI